MTREEILAAAGYPNTPDGIAAFYNEYDTPEKFFAKHGGSLSGAPHNGQPTADQFFDYGSHANDKLNIPMSNPFYLEEGGAYYGGPIRPYKKGGLTKYQKKGEVINPWQTPGATNPDNPNFIHSTTPGTTRWLTKEGKTPFQELLSKPKTYGSGKWTAQDTLIQNDPRLFNIEKTLEAKPEYKQAYWGSPIMRDLDEAERAEAYMLTYGDLRSLINQTGTAKGSNPDPYDQMYYNAIQGNESGNAKPVSSDVEKKLRFYSKAKKYGGDITEFCWGGGLPGGPNEMPEMLHGGYHSPMNYGSFPATEWGGALDPSNKDAFPMMEEGGLKQFLKSVSKAKKKAYKEGGKTTIQGGNQNFLENRRAAFDDALKNNVYNAFIQEEEKAAMQAMNPYAAQDMQEEDQEYTEAKYGLSTYRKKGEKKPQDDDRLIDYRKAYPDLFPVGRDYSQYIPANIQSQYFMSNADYAKMADLNKRVQSGTFKLNENGFEGTPEWGPMARLLGKTGRKMFGPKSVTYKFTGRPKTLITDADRAAEAAKAKNLQSPTDSTPSSLMNDYFNQESTEYEDTAGTGSRNMIEPENMKMRKGQMPDGLKESIYMRNLMLKKNPLMQEYPQDYDNNEFQDRANYSDQYIQKQAALPIDDGSLMQKAKGYYSPFAQFFTPSTYGPGYSSEYFEVDPSKLRTTPDQSTQQKIEDFNRRLRNKKYGGILNRYQGGGLTQEQYDELIRLYNAAEQASKTSKKNQATLDFQKKFHEYEPTKQIAQGLLKERQTANNPTAYGRTLGADQMYSTLSNEDMYFGDTTKRYRAGLENLKPQPQPTATPAPDLMTPKQANLNTGVTGNIAQSNIPQLTSTTPVSTMTPNKVSLNSNITGNIAQTTPQLGSSASSTDLNKPFEMTPRQVKLDTNQPAEIKPAKPFEYKEGPEEIIESKIKRKTKGIGKAIGQYAPGAANWLASNLEQKPELDPMQNQPIVLGDPGDYDINSGEFRLRSKVPVQFPGGYGAYRTKFGGALPQALSGLEVKMQPGLYGTNGNRQFSLPTQIDSQKYAQQPTEVRNSLTAVPRDQANLEAEGGETALVNIDGIPAHFKISGKRHSQGGVPLDLPDNSFIYSDTASMKIKDPNILAQFGMAPKKGGYTPAEIAKKYDINKYRKILSDPNSEALERKTAEAMIANNNMKLAKLAMAQESLKGFPQGIPVVAMPYMMANDIDPSMYIPTQGQEEQPDADMGVSRYGGNIVAQYPTMRYGGLPKAQKGKNKIPQLSYDELYRKQQDVLNKLNYLRDNDEDNPAIAQLADQYNQYEGLIAELYGKTLAEREKFSDVAKGRERSKTLNIPEDSEWVSESGDRFDEEGNLVQEHGYFDPRSVGDYFGKIGKRFTGERTQFAPPPESGMGVVDNPGKKKVKQFVSKLNPANAEGVLDYAANIVNYPLYGVNNLLTGQWESTGNLYTDVALDPTTYFGVKPYTAPIQGAKYIGKLAMQYGPEVGRFLQKYGARGLEIIQRYGAAGIDAIKKYGKKGIDYVVKGAQYVAEKAPIVAKKIAENTPPGAVVNVISRGLQGYAQEKKKDKEIEKLELQNEMLKEAILKPDSLVVRPSKPKETPKINVNAELAKKLTIAQAKKAEAEYAQAMQNMNRFTGYTNIPQEERLASLRTLGQKMLPAQAPMVAPSAPVVAPATPTKNIEVIKKPAAKTSNTDWENVDWSKYEVKKK